MTFEDGDLDEVDLRDDIALPTESEDINEREWIY